MSRMLKKFIRPDAIDGSKIKLLNSEALRASAADGVSVISILKVNASDVPEFLTLPIATQDPTDAQHLARKGYVDQKISDLIGAAPALLDTLQELAAALGNDENFATSLATQLGDIRDRLDTLEGGVSVEGSVAKAANDALDAAKAYTDDEVLLDRNRLDTLEGADTVAGSVAKAAKDALDAAKVYADGVETRLDDRLDIVEGDATVEGSVAKAEADAKAYADTIQTALDDRLDVLEGTGEGSVAKAEADAVAHADGLNTAMDTRVASIEALAFHKEKKVIGQMEVMQGYVDLAHEAVANSTFLFIQGGGYLYEGDDYSLSVEGGVSRVTFLGEFAAAGVTALEDGDVLACQYQYAGAGSGGNSGGGGGEQTFTISAASYGPDPAMMDPNIIVVNWTANNSNGSTIYYLWQNPSAGVYVDPIYLAADPDISATVDLSLIDPTAMYVVGGGDAYSEQFSIPEGTYGVLPALPSANIQNLAVSSTSYLTNLTGQCVRGFYIANPGPATVNQIGTYLTKDGSSSVEVRFAIYYSDNDSAYTAGAANLIGQTANFGLNDASVYSENPADMLLMKSLTAEATLPDATAYPFLFFVVLTENGSASSPVGATRTIDVGPETKHYRSQDNTLGTSWEPASMQKVGYKLTGL